MFWKLLEEHNVSTCELLIRELVSFWESYVCGNLTLEDFSRAISMLRANHFPRHVTRTLNLHYTLEWVQGWWIGAHVTYAECGPTEMSSSACWVVQLFGMTSRLLMLGFRNVSLGFFTSSSQELCAEFITWWPLFWLDAALAVHCLLRVAAICSYSVSPAELSSLPRSASLRLMRPKSQAIVSLLPSTVSPLLLQHFASCSNWDASWEVHFGFASLS